MPAGKYRHRIRIEAPRRDTNAEGQQVPDWPWADDQPFAEVWAAVSVGGEQQQVQRQQQTLIPATVQVRSSVTTRAIRPGMRFKFNGLTFNIASAEDAEGLKQEITIKATAVRPADECA